MDHIHCQSRKCHQRLTERRHNLRSNRSRLSEVRDIVFPGRKEKPANQKDVFNLLVAVEQLQRYVENHLDENLLKHDMITVRGTSKSCRHCCCEG